MILARRLSARARVVLLAVTCLGSSLACAGSPRPWEAEPVVQVEPALAPPVRREIEEGVLAFERGELGEARRHFARAGESAPGDAAVAIWIQEADLATAERRARALGLPTEGPNSPAAQLRRQYRRAAEREPGPLTYLLAARLEDDPLAATLLLEKALEFDPDAVWIHYGLAHNAARRGDWAAVHLALERTFELDPGHLPALRLFAWFQASAGDLEQAIAAYEAWRERADEDLLATREVRERILLDLALAYLAAEREPRARDLLRELSGSDLDEARLDSARAAALEARDEPRRAREVAAGARALDAEALLPAVQEALLLELWLDDPRAAAKAWRRVLARAEGRADLAAGLQRFRAQVHLERLARRGVGVSP